MEENIPEVPEVDTTPVQVPAEPTDEGTGIDPVEQHSQYWLFLDELEGQFRSFLSDARAGDINKSAALRARKSSVDLRKSLKEFREVSVAHDKTHGRKTKKEVQLSKEIDTL